MTSCALTASAGSGPYRAYHGVVSPAAPGTEALSHRLRPSVTPNGRRVLRRGGRPGPGSFPARSRARPRGPVSLRRLGSSYDKLRPRNCSFLAVRRWDTPSLGPNELGVRLLPRIPRLLFLRRAWLRGAPPTTTEHRAGGTPSFATRRDFNLQGVDEPPRPLRLVPSDGVGHPRLRLRPPLPSDGPAAGRGAPPRPACGSHADFADRFLLHERLPALSLLSPPPRPTPTLGYSTVG